MRPNQYRLRLLNACDSRTLSLSAWAVPAGTTVSDFVDLWDAGEELPIYIIGTEQGLLPSGPAKILSRVFIDGTNDVRGTVTKFNCGIEDTNIDLTAPHQGLLMQPGERYDAIIDFGDSEGKEVYLINTGKYIIVSFASS